LEFYYHDVENDVLILVEDALAAFREGD